VPWLLKLDELSRMTDLAEITPWTLMSEPEAADLAERIRHAASRTCGRTIRSGCVLEVFKTLDTWYSTVPNFQGLRLEFRPARNGATRFSIIRVEGGHGAGAEGRRLPCRGDALKLVAEMLEVLC
jgi:hypothetical protein